nr:MAG TPA: hypothetical protein [Caudoviricetes sp.]
MFLYFIVRPNIDAPSELPFSCRLTVYVEPYNPSQSVIKKGDSDVSVKIIEYPFELVQVIVLYSFSPKNHHAPFSL